MAEIIFRLPGNAQYSYVEVKFDADEVRTGAPEDTQAILQGALADLNAAYPEVTAAPAFAAPQAEPVDPTKTCKHGQRVLKTGESAKGKWSGWMCPSRDRADQCKAIWNN